jgi:hypothetical protein
MTMSSIVLAIVWYLGLLAVLVAVPFVLHLIGKSEALRTLIRLLFFE